MTVTEETSAMLDPSSGTDANLQHLRYLLIGYRSRVLDNVDCPFTPGSAMERSWRQGFSLASADLAAK